MIKFLISTTLLILLSFCFLNSHLVYALDSNQEEAYKLKQQAQIQEEAYKLKQQAQIQEEAYKLKQQAQMLEQDQNSSKQAQDLVNDIKKSDALNFIDRPVISLFKTEADSCFDCVTRQVNAHPNNSVKGICKVVVNSKTCQSIPKESRIDCNNWRQTSSTGKIAGCLSGALTGVIDVFLLGWSIIKGMATIGNEIGKFVTGSEKGKKTKEAVATSLLFLANEYDKVRDENDRTKAVPDFPGHSFLFVVGAFVNNPLSKIWKVSADFLKKEYKEFGCLNAEAKAEATCYTVFSIAGGAGGTYGTAKGTKAAWRKLRNKEIDKLLKNDPEINELQTRLARHKNQKQKLAQEKGEKQKLAQKKQADKQKLAQKKQAEEQKLAQKKAEEKKLAQKKAEEKKLAQKKDKKDDDDGPITGNLPVDLHILGLIP